jgi:nucleotide-binding universal stress UspA family protein
MSAVIVPVVPSIALKRILFATDFTEASHTALPVVSAIARRYGAKVFAAYVWSHGPYSLVAPEVVAMLDRQTEQAVRLSLEKLLQSQPLAGIEAEALVRSGRAPEAIGRLVDQYHIDLVVMSTHGKTGFKHRFLGSITEEVVRTLRCPVLTAGPHLEPRFAGAKGIGDILFPTDLSQGSLAVFPYLTSLAHEYESRLTILHVLSPATSAQPGKGQRADFVRAWMKGTLSKEISPRSQAEYVVACGDVTETILEHAHHSHADLIGLGVRHGPDAARPLSETRAYRILAEAECPVLTAH